MTSFKDYPYWSAESLDEVKEQLRQITNTRKDDITQIANLSNVFVAGRKVGRVPSGSADVLAGDCVGDVNYSASFLYILIDNAGTPAWRRVALSAW
jgi:hypothetical protein